MTDSRRVCHRRKRYLVIIKPMSPAQCWVDWHRKNTTRTCVAVSSDPPPLVILSRQKLKSRTTKNGQAAGNKVRQPHHPSQLLRRKRCTLTEVSPSKSFGPSETLYRSRSYHTPRRFQYHALSSIPAFLFPVADPWAVVENENMQECCWRLGFRQ